MAGAAVTRFGAVIFDLYGTLVPEFAAADWDEHFERMATALSVDATTLRREWQATAIERQTGRMGDIAANIRSICERVGRRPTDHQLEAALRVRAWLYAKYFRPRPGAAETLRALKRDGYATALVSMCAPDTPELWRASTLAPFVDVEVFSSEVGLRKPEPAIYLLACSGLGVEPAACLYVGDGSYGELTGAAALGMRAVLIRDADEVEGEIHRPEVEQWTGPRIARLSETLDLLRA